LHSIHRSLDTLLTIWKAAMTPCLIKKYIFLKLNKFSIWRQDPMTNASNAVQLPVQKLECLFGIKHRNNSIVSIWRIFRQRHTFFSMFRTQFPTDFFVSEHYGLWNTIFWWSKDLASALTFYSCVFRFQRNSVGTSHKKDVGTSPRRNAGRSLNTNAGTSLNRFAQTFRLRYVGGVQVPFP
jgi:hypothetical protein